VLAEDIGRALGCGACLAALRRTAVGEFDLNSGTITLGELQSMTLAEREFHLMPVDSLVASLPRIDLDVRETRRIVTGGVIEIPGIRDAGIARIYGPARDFVGIAEIDAAGRIVPQRLISQPPLIPDDPEPVVMLEKTRG